MMNQIKQLTVIFKSFCFGVLKITQKSKIDILILIGQIMNFETVNQLFDCDVFVVASQVKYFKS